jgi:hypothetical protein
MNRLKSSLTMAVLLSLGALSTSAWAASGAYTLRVFAKGVLAQPVALGTAEPTSPAQAASVAAWEVTGTGSFTSAKVGAQAALLPITVKNTGTASGTPSVSAFYNGQPADFSVSNNGCSGSVAIGQSCTVSVGFTPSAMGARFSDLKIAETVIHVTGEGLNPDPYAAQVSLSLAMDAPDGTTTFADANGLTVTSVGAVHRVAFSNGGTAGYFNGASKSSLVTASNTAFGFGTGDFTMESWVNYSTGGLIVSLRTDATKTYYNNVMQIQSNRLAWSDGSTWHTSSIAVPANAWAHVAVTRASGIVRLFVNGTLAGQVNQPMDLGTSRVARIGILEDNYIPYTGYMADLRITKGVARYTANFTPPSL